MSNVFQGNRSNLGAVPTPTSPSPVPNPSPATGVTPTEGFDARQQVKGAPYVAAHVSNALTGIIGPRMVVRGDIDFEGELRIQGPVHGNISTQGESQSVLIVDPNAKIIGNVTVPSLKVSGNIEGEVKAIENVLIQSTGVIKGNVSYKTIQMESGAKIIGGMNPTNE